MLKNPTKKKCRKLQFSRLNHKHLDNDSKECFFFISTVALERASAFLNEFDETDLLCTRAKKNGWHHNSPPTPTRPIINSQPCAIFTATVLFPHKKYVILIHDPRYFIVKFNRQFDSVGITKGAILRNLIWPLFEMSLFS